MKRKSLAFTLATALGLLTWSVGPNIPAFSQAETIPYTTLLRCTREEPLLKALTLLENSQTGKASLATILNKPVRIVFKDMKMVHKALKNYDALSWISNQGQQVIFINEKHRMAPPEALAAVIAHEALHDDPFNSLQEEVESWQVEARVWVEFKGKNPELAKIPPGQSALVDRENRIEEEYRKGSLASFVRGTPGYQGLPEVSPGFGPTSISNKDNQTAF
jgi:hypothetical protein